VVVRQRASSDAPGRGEVEAIAGDERRRRLLELYAEDSGPAVELIDATPELMPMTPIHTLPQLPA
jgi:FAD-dependent urate hydroxylase